MKAMVHWIEHHCPPPRYAPDGDSFQTRSDLPCPWIACTMRFETRDRLAAHISQCDLRRVIQPYRCPCCERVERLSRFRVSTIGKSPTEDAVKPAHRRQDSSDDPDQDHVVLRRCVTDPYYQSLSRMNEAYFRLLVSGKGIFFDGKRDWSGKRQHIVLFKTEDPPLKHIGQIHSSEKVFVDEVTCLAPKFAGVRLARKRVQCDPTFTPSMALDEVKHLQRIRHAHIIQLMGTYCQNNRFNILLYPVADFDLHSLMDSMTNSAMPAHLKPAYRRNLVRAFGCLSHALAHIHQKGVKHMDIKPRNILVKHRRREGMAMDDIDLRFYITDFDIARPIRDPGHSMTNGQTGLSFLYCAPEVAPQDETSRGRSADIFSMGCVMLEMVGVVLDISPQRALWYRYRDNKSYHDNLEKVFEWIELLRNQAARGIWTFASNDTGFNTIRAMLNPDPDLRPSAADLERRCFGSSNCCREAPEDFEPAPAELEIFGRSCRTVLP